MSETAHTPASGIAEATAALASAMSGEAASPAAAPSTPTAEPGPTPSSAPAAAPQTPAPPVVDVFHPSAPAGEPKPAAGTPAAPTTPADLSDPAARRFLEMQGGDLQKALSKALQYNNRLAQLHREHPELFQPGGPADPARALEIAEPVPFEEPPPVAPSAIPIPRVELDPNVIRAQVEQAVYQDPESTNLIKAFIGNDSELKKLGSEMMQLRDSIAYEQRKLTDPEFSPDDLRRPQMEDKIARMETKLGLIEQRAARIDLHNERLNARFEQRRDLLANYIHGQFQSRAEEEAFTAYERNVEDVEYRKTLVEWPSALERCIKENNIPPEQVEDFKLDAQREFQAAMSDPERVINDMYAFLSPVAKRIAARLDRYHRVRAGQYASGATTRAATPSPATGPGTPAPPPQSAYPTPEEAMANASKYLRQRLRG